MQKFELSLAQQVKLDDDLFFELCQQLDAFVILGWVWMPNVRLYFG